MDYLRIGESKLKITLSSDELDSYGMDLSELDYASTETRRAFWAILDDAKRATGFDAAASRVSVQIYTSKTGGCEIFVTSSPTAAGYRSLTDDKTMALTVCGALPKLYGESVCSFDSISDLLTACKVLMAQGCCCESSAWQLPSFGRMGGDMGARYYLYLAGNHAPKASGTVNSSGILAEFGSPLPELDLSYLSEHCLPLVSERAVEQLAKLAV